MKLLMLLWLTTTTNLAIVDDAKEFCKCLISKGVDVTCQMADLYIAHWLLDPDSKREISLDSLCQLYSADVPNVEEKFP